MKRARFAFVVLLGLTAGAHAAKQGSTLPKDAVLLMPVKEKKLGGPTGALKVLGGPLANNVPPGRKVKFQLSTFGTQKAAAIYDRVALGSVGWSLSMTGLKADEDVHVNVQVPSQELVLPKTAMGMREALIDALRFERFSVIPAERHGGGSLQLTQELDLRPFWAPNRKLDPTPYELPANTPVEITGVSRGRVRWRGVTHAVGESDVQAHYWVGNMYRRVGYIGRGGSLQGEYQPWVKADNLYLTPAYKREGVSHAEAVLGGWAAFPFGAIVTVSNVSMTTRGQRGATVRRNASKTSGSARIVLPVDGPHDEFVMTVELPGGKQYTSPRFRLPDPESPDVAAHGVNYYPLQRWNSIASWH
jgi:hypothetical protein